ncbi:MAG: F0F1 ATP synthase subunit gamma, partial [Mycoplasmoidaceae bacterium]|nr:F0F1 ATP synthase subunit gamma [Mycoplasmoidaceae bacterium]
DLYRSEKFGKVELVFTKFVNSMTFNTTNLKILPLDNTLFDQLETNKKLSLMYDSINDKGQLIEYDSPKHLIYQSIMPTFVTTLIFASIIESELCESGSRRNAMDTATKNAKELTNNLLLQFNRVRQEKITQEINEIVAGGATND